jgi:two-component system, OmpR family, phosphate regulon sensor histidine kinase PhoR
VALLIAVLVAVDLYSARVIRSQAIRSANSELTSLLNVAQTRPPQASDPEDLRQWTEWMAKSGARVTIVGSNGQVLADSATEATSMENHADRPEVEQAMANGRGASVHRSVTLDRELVYQAVRYQEADGQSIVIRLAVPLSEIDLSVKELRGRLLIASFVVLLIGAIASLGFARMFSARIEKLKDFSQRIAEGNFRP